MNSALTQIREKIADLETKIVDLRIAEQELLAIELAFSQKEMAPARLKAEQTPRLISLSSTRQTIGAAIMEVLSTRGALSVAHIAEEIEAGGREIDRRKISFALQALKKQGRAELDDGNWVLTEGLAKRVSRTHPKGNLKKETRRFKAMQTVADHISSVLRQNGALALAELARNIHADGGKVKNSTLSNTLQKMKLRGLIDSADGKWQLAAAK